MPKYSNKIVKNIKSPSNENDYRQVYKKLNKNANKNDELDIAAVKTKDGIKGHALLHQKHNRSKDINNISDTNLSQTKN